MQFVDKCLIELSSGKGGDGIVAWRREANYPEGGPWGGDGGNGGNVYIVGDHNLSTLSNFKFIKRICAEDGENGKSKLCHGRNGKDEIVKVPIGTSVIDSNTNELIVDILKHNQTFKICSGGKGGHGNAFFKSSFNKAPSLCERGEKAELVKVIFNLKYIADVGIIGLPNAGKSTFINDISNANSKVGNYQFTTINPVLGTVSQEKKTLVFADIPGLIEGASSGVGLGHEFLKHIERCSVLIHMISLSKEDNVEIKKAFEIIQNELKMYRQEILNKKIFIVANKIDTSSAQENLKILKKVVKKQKIYEISALDKIGVDDLIKDIFDYFNSNIFNIKKTDFEENSYSEIKLDKELPNDFIFEKIDDNTWKVISSKIDYWYNKIPQNTPDNITRFHQKINLIQIELELKKLGAKVGDVFWISDMEYIIE